MRQCGPLVTTVWKDNKEVSVLSSNVQPDERGTVRRMQSNATQLEVAASNAIISYNKWIGGVDWGDQMCQYYNLRLYRRKFYTTSKV